MKEYFRKPYMTQGIGKHRDYMKAIPQRAIDVQGQIAANIEFKKPYDYHPNTAQMIHYYANNLHYFGGDPVPPITDPSLLPHNPQPPVTEETVIILPSTFNPKDKHPSVELYNANLGWKRQATFGGMVRTYVGNITKKWYVEATLEAALETGALCSLGLVPLIADLSLNPGDTDTTYAIRTRQTTISYEVAIGNNNIWTPISANLTSLKNIMMAMNFDEGKVWLGQEGVWYNTGDPVAGTNPTFSGLSGRYYVAAGKYNITQDSSHGLANFGGTSFNYTVPDGYNNGFYQLQS